MTDVNAIIQKVMGTIWSKRQQADALHDEADILQDMWTDGDWDGLVQWGIIKRREAKALEEAETPPWER